MISQVQNDNNYRKTVIKNTRIFDFYYYQVVLSSLYIRTSSLNTIRPTIGQNLRDFEIFEKYVRLYGIVYTAKKENVFKII